MQMSGGEKATADRGFRSGLKSSSGGELKLYLDWKRNTRECIYQNIEISDLP